MTAFGFKRAKQQVLAALREGTYQHEARGDLNVKNALAIGEISPRELIAIIERCNGTHHHASPHHSYPLIEVHVLRRDGWYIKFYFLNPDTIFISVHR